MLKFKILHTKILLDRRVTSFMFNLKDVYRPCEQANFYTVLYYSIFVSSRLGAVLFLRECYVL